MQNLSNKTQDIQSANGVLFSRLTVYCQLLSGIVIHTPAHSILDSNCSVFILLSKYSKILSNSLTETDSFSSSKPWSTATGHWDGARDFYIYIDHSEPLARGDCQ